MKYIAQAIGGALGMSMDQLRKYAATREGLKKILAVAAGLGFAYDDIVEALDWAGVFDKDAIQAILGSDVPGDASSVPVLSVESAETADEYRALAMKMKDDFDLIRSASGMVGGASRLLKLKKALELPEATYKAYLEA